MDVVAQGEAGASATNPSGDLKRKRSPSNEINYLARQYNEDLPLISNDDTLPSILALLGEYQGVLERHESMAGNLGARPLGPILIKRFERLFDGPPKVLKSHGKEGTTVTWLDVVEFARNKPDQFHLGQMSEGLRVCQFYTKQCRVQISEEDFVLISSGIPQKMIPPQPIVEDEEKELGTLEILEKNLAQICQLADQVAARTRQLNHRIKGRKQAILDRRATEPYAAYRVSPSDVALLNGAGATASAALASLSQGGQTPGGGFVAVNARPTSDLNGGGDAGINKNGASPATRQELLSKFSTLSERRAQRATSFHGELRRSSTSASTPGAPHTTTTTAPSIPSTAARAPSKPPLSSHNSASALPSTTSYPDPTTTTDYNLHLLSGTSPHPTPVAIPHTPTSLLPPQHHSHNPTTGGPGPAPGAAAGRTASVEKDDGGPYKAEMVSRMDGLAKGERVLPPCDRCRRLHMDCLKNLTACMGCTKKHAKCSWREVREGELRETAAAAAAAAALAAGAGEAQGRVDDALGLGHGGSMSGAGGLGGVAGQGESYHHEAGAEGHSDAELGRELRAAMSPDVEQQQQHQRQHQHLYARERALTPGVPPHVVPEARMVPPVPAVAVEDEQMADVPAAQVQVRLRSQSPPVAAGSGPGPGPGDGSGRGGAEDAGAGAGGMQQQRAVVV